MRDIRQTVAIGGMVATMLLHVGPAPAQTAAQVQEECGQPPLDLDGATFTFKSAKKAFREARSLYRRGASDKALGAIEAGLAVDATDSDLLCLRGDVLMKKRQFASALAAYEECLPQIKRRANQRTVRKAIAELQVVTSTYVMVEVTNGPATLYLDSKREGAWGVANNTCKKAVFPKSYRLYVEREGFEDKREVVTGKPGETTSVQVTLVEKPSRLEVAVTPDDATVTLDGEELGVGPQAKDDVAAGEHQLVVSAAGYATTTRTLSLHEGKPESIEVALDEVVAVTVPDVPGVRVLLDGAPVEVQADAVVVTPGAHTLRFEAEGYEPREVEIPEQRERGHAVSVPDMVKIPEPEPEPEPEPVYKEWTPLKIGAVGATGVVAVVGMAAAGVQGSRAGSRWSEAEAACANGDDVSVVCDDAGQVVADDARSLASQANLWFTIGAVSGLGALAAWNWRQPAPAEGGMTSRRKISLGVAAGVAAVGLGVGTVYGLRAGSRRSRADETCDDDNVCDRAGFVAATQALDDAGVSNLGFLVAAAAAGTAAYLWLAPYGESSATGERSTAVHINPAVGPDQVGVLVTGGF